MIDNPRIIIYKSGIPIASRVNDNIIPINKGIPIVIPNIFVLSDIFSILTNKLFPEYRKVKAYIQTFFRRLLVRCFLSSSSLLHYQRKVARPICVYHTPENYKQGVSDSCSPSELVPASRIKYQVPLNCLASDKRVNGFAYQSYQPQITKKETSTPIASGTNLLLCAMG